MRARSGRHGNRGRRGARAWAFAAATLGQLALLGGCAPTDLELVALLPRSLDDGLLSRVSHVELRAIPALDDERVASAEALSDLAVPDLAAGIWGFRLTAFDEEQAVLLSGSTDGVEVRRRGGGKIRMVLAPPEAIVELPVTSDDADEIAQRRQLSATTVIDADGRAVVLVAGGLVAGEPTRDAWLYDPREVSFERIAAMECPRAGHSAAAIEVRGRPRVLIAGGGDALCSAAADGARAGDTIELFDLEQRQFIPFDTGIEATLVADEELDLSAAMLAPYAEERVFLAAGAMAWSIQLDVGGRPSADRLDTKGETTEGGVAVPLAVETTPPGPASFGVIGGESASLLVFDDEELCFSFGQVAFPTTGHAAAGLAPRRALVTEGDTFWLLDVPGCAALPNVTIGSISPERTEHTATVLSDGRILLVGGAGEERPAMTSIFLVSSTGEIAQHPGPLSLRGSTGHAAASLPDGTALLLGGRRPAELFNPAPTARATRDNFRFGARPDPEDGFWTVFVVDGTAEGSTVRDLVAPHAWDMGPQDPGSDVNLLGSGIGVLPSYAGAGSFIDVSGCEPGHRVPEWSLCESETTTGTPPSLLSPQGDEVETTLTCRIGEASNGPIRETPCPVAQPLATLRELVGQVRSGRGTFADEIAPRFGAILVVLVTHGEDCSVESDGEAQPFSPESCSEASSMIAPREVAELLLAPEGFDLRIEVALLYGHDDDGSCALPPRLATFADHASGFGTVVTLPVCTSDQAAQAASSVNEMARALVHRSVCAEPRQGQGETHCSLSATRRTTLGETVEPLAPSADWVKDPAAERCARLDGENWDLLQLEPGYAFPPDPEAGSFLNYQYVCW